MGRSKGEAGPGFGHGSQARPKRAHPPQQGGGRPGAERATRQGEPSGESSHRPARDRLPRDKEIPGPATTAGRGERRPPVRGALPSPRVSGPGTVADLRARLRAIDGRGYSAYKDIVGEYRFPQFTLFVDFVQGDPYAPPSRLRVRVSQAIAGFPPDLLSPKIRRVALADFLGRAFAAAIRKHVRGSRGIGPSGTIAVDVGEQEILERTSCVVCPEFVEVRFSAALPSAGRTISGRDAMAMLLDEVPRVVGSALVRSALDEASLRRHVAVAEDQEALRAQLAERHLVAFVADGAVLPRASGVSQRPLTGPQVVPFESPPELRTELATPNRGRVTGMGVPQGVSLIVGGGFHGKSTLLAALDRGVYNHIPGDGREYVVTRSDAVRIRAEDGRPAERVNISAFVDGLPFQKDTTSFTTDNASGSTSQAVNIVEALEVGTKLLLVDEDTSATNFMIRDARMQRLIPNAWEPITPFIDQVRNLFADYSVSTVLVVGGSGDYFDVADTVIAMHDYRPVLVTDAARDVARELPSHRVSESRERFGAVTKRAVVAESVNPYRRGKPRVQARGRHALEFGGVTIDLSAVEQLVDAGQTRAIGDLILYCLHRGYFEADTPLSEALARALSDLDIRGLEVLSPHGAAGDYARPRLYEVAAALNRLRGLRVKQVGV